MSTDPLTRVNTRRTPQTERADSRQVPNSGGGYAFALDDLARLHRFLVLGTDGGTYYATESELTRDNAEVVLRLARDRPVDLVNTVVEVSTSGRAPRQQPCLFALAVAASSPDLDARSYALDFLPTVARTGTHLFQFARYVEQFRGWGPTLRRGVASWYLDKTIPDLAYQVIKYRQREGWTHRDLLRLAHPVVHVPDPDHTTDDDEVILPRSRVALFNWISNGDVETSHAPNSDATHTVVERPIIATSDDLPDIVLAFEEARRTTNARVHAQLVLDHGLPWEALPDSSLNHPTVWEALMQRGLPQTALLRQLPRLTRLGLVTPLAAWTERVCAQLTDAERLRRARVHPLAVLTAHKTYAQGHGDRGSATWTPSRPVVDALDAAFYASFGAVESTGRRVMLALDVSRSMTMGRVARSPLTPREASAALALVTASVESNYELVGFTSGSRPSRWSQITGMGSGLTPLAISPRQRLADAVEAVSNLPFGGTDCALPMLHALERDLEVDAFVIYTDSETWAGVEHPHEALRRYRERTGIDARLVVVGLTSTGFTIAEPTDAGMLDVVGFDLATPRLISDFVRGDVVHST